jgi:hypothetical protein
LVDRRASLLSELNILQSSYANMKDDIKYEISLMQYDDEREKQMFQTALSMYNTERDRMDQFQILEIQEKSKVMAEQREQAWTLKMKEFEANLQAQVRQEERDYQATQKK